jgi:hypothetical protein
MAWAWHIASLSSILTAENNVEENADILQARK